MNRAVGRRSAGRGGTLTQTPWTGLRVIDAPTCPLDAEGVAAIDAAAMRILSEVGIDFLHETAKAHLRDAGATVDPFGDRVRFDPAMVREFVARAPSSFSVTSRNPDRAITVGDDAQLFGTVASAPNCSELDRGRRSGDRAAFRDLLKLPQAFNCVHFVSGYPVEPTDLHAGIRHLDALHDILTLTDKVTHVYSLGTERIEDAMEMVRIAGGLSHAAFDAAPRTFTNINSSSPPKHD